VPAPRTAWRRDRRAAEGQDPQRPGRAEPIEDWVTENAAEEHGIDIRDAAFPGLAPGRPVVDYATPLGAASAGSRRGLALTEPEPEPEPAARPAGTKTQTTQGRTAEGDSAGRNPEEGPMRAKRWLGVPRWLYAVVALGVVVCFLVFGAASPPEPVPRRISEVGAGLHHVGVRGAERTGDHRRRTRA
jgi:hypothetical protein